MLILWNNIIQCFRVYTYIFLFMVRAMINKHGIYFQHSAKSNFFGRRTMSLYCYDMVWQLTKNLKPRLQIMSWNIPHSLHSKKTQRHGTMILSYYSGYPDDYEKIPRIVNSLRLIFIYWNGKTIWKCILQIVWRY